MKLLVRPGSISRALRRLLIAVVAVVSLFQPEQALALKGRMQRHCQHRLSPYMVPVKVEVTDTEQFNARWKRVRNG